PDSFVIIQSPAGGDLAMPITLQAILVQAVTTTARSDYATSAKITRLDLKRDWRKLTEDRGDSFTMTDLRRTVVLGQTERLTLAEEPLLDDIGGQTIEMARLYDGLEAGRWLIVSGERTDIAATPGVRASELVMLAGVEQSYDPLLPGDKTHSRLLLEGGQGAASAGQKSGLAYTYRRDSVKIYANVVKATNGETRGEVLGSGDATQAFQQFALKQPPLTYVSAPTVEGVESTLHVRVNDVEWHEADSLAWLGPNDRKFATVTDDDAKTSVVFGDGNYGVRPPTGIENITAVYRSGIGKGGNVKAEQITLPITKPLGVKEVINPLRASGGADKEGRDLARRNAPLAVMALDRLVSTQDYADFVRTFGGIGKASARRLSDGLHQFVHLTIAGVEDIPIDTTSDLYQNLRRALQTYGDPFQAVQIAVRELLALVISAHVHILPDYLEEKVGPKIRQTLLDLFGFDNRELGQPAFLSEAIAAIQRVEGVAYVVVDLFDSVSDDKLRAVLIPEDSQPQTGGSANPSANNPSGGTASGSGVTTGLNLKLNRAVRAESATSADGKVKPAQLAVLLPDVPETLILNITKEATR
ncbi:MAG TPA: putative baseplate assembly protein, partial [Blastocatellia bacterium]|nr:putative baseplate assembly protein [Blastocatellia bacterium]